MNTKTLIATTIGLASARWSLGSCPEYSNMEDFDADRFAGRWYQNYRSWGSVIYTIGTDCVTQEYWPAEDESGDLDLFFRGKYWWMYYAGSGGTMYYCDEATPESEDGWTCKATMGGGTKKSPFQIWKTDYDNYVM